MNAKERERESESDVERSLVVPIYTTHLSIYSIIIIYLFATV